LKFKFLYKVTSMIGTFSTAMRVNFLLLFLLVNGMDGMCSFPGNMASDRRFFNSDGITKSGIIEYWTSAEDAIEVSSGGLICKLIFIKII
jgi:hypothetical protein